MAAISARAAGSLIDNEPDNYEALCQQARTLLEEAGGVKAAGQITLLYDSTDETAARTAAAVQDAWKQKLGLIAILRGATAQELAGRPEPGRVYGSPDHRHRRPGRRLGPAVPVGKRQWVLLFHRL